MTTFLKEYYYKYWFGLSLPSLHSFSNAKRAFVDDTRINR